MTPRCRACRLHVWWSGGFAARAAFLAGDAAANVNGVTIPVDGGAAVSMTTDAYMLGQLSARSAFLKEI